MTTNIDAPYTVKNYPNKEQGKRWAVLTSNNEVEAYTWCRESATTIANLLNAAPQPQVASTTATDALLKAALSALKYITNKADDNDDAPDGISDGRLTIGGYNAAKAVLAQAAELKVL